MPAQIRPLDADWTLRAIAGPVPAHLAPAAGGPLTVPATVPGTVHTDLLAAGLIPDPYLDDHEVQLAWIGLSDWSYQKSFDWDDADPDPALRTDLVFHGLDTVAAVELNGELIAATENMHRTYRFDVRDRLRNGVNTLVVTFASAVRFADRRSLELGFRPHLYPHPFNAIRKMACNFGWDWGPILVTAGIWRPAVLHTWRAARLSEVRPVVEVSGPGGTVDVHLTVERAPGSADTDLVVTAEVAGARGELALPGGTSSGVLHLEVTQADRWWPRGHGDQPLYDLTVTLALALANEAAPADSVDPAQSLQVWAQPIGFRSVRLDILPDADGTSFTFVVNDRPIFVKGANWIPDDVFPHRVTRQRCAERLTQAEEAGNNLLRIWGGGLFEDDVFYAECDQRGLMVWQDFPFACSTYSEDDPLRAEVIAEARDNVTRLMPHTSLVLWNGCNENISGHRDWGWTEELDGKTWGLGYYLDVLPAIVSELDPGRAYIPSSPFSFRGEDIHPNDPAHGTTHTWDVWGQLDYVHYRDHAARFGAEFGWQGPPAFSTLKRAISDDPLTPESPGMLNHQKAPGGNNKLTHGLLHRWPLPDDMDDWHWGMSLNQARAIKLGLEHFRSLTPLCGGTVLWQLNDCWPVTSWSVIDGYGRRKPGFYAMRQAYADQLITIQPRGEKLAVVLANDTAVAWSGPVTVIRHSYDGKVIQSVVLAADVQPWAAQTLLLPDEIGTAQDAARELVVAQIGAEDGAVDLNGAVDVNGAVAESDAVAEVGAVAEGAAATGSGRAVWFFAEDRYSALTAPALRAKARRTPTGYRVDITAEVLLRDLSLLVDKVDPEAAVDDMLLTLLPGETATWLITSEAEFDPEALLAPSVLRSSNQLLPKAAPKLTA